MITSRIHLYPASQNSQNTAPPPARPTPKTRKFNFNHGSDLIQDSFTDTPRIEKTITVLVAEDNFTNQVLTRTLLQKFGLNLTLVNNGYEAIGACRIQKFDLILMDIEMPQLNGIEATQYIRRHKGPNQSSVIIALTAFGSPSEKYTYQHSGIDHVITKPLKLEAIRDVLENHFNIALQTVAQPQFNTLTGPVVIDPAIIGQLAARHDVSALRSVFQSFWHIADGLYEDMDRAFGAWDRDGLSSAAHALKGAAANLGLSEISALSADATNANPEQARQVMMHLSSAIARGKTALTVFLRELS